MFRGVSRRIRGCFEVSRCLCLVLFGKGDGKQGTIRMHIRACLRCSARLPFSLHARSVGRKRKYWRIASTSRYGDLPFLRSCPPSFRNVKICKLYLYNNEHALALSQHTIHIRRFSDFSRGWGIGEETFEFWSWIARQ